MCELSVITKQVLSRDLDSPHQIEAIVNPVSPKKLLDTLSESFSALSTSDGLRVLPDFCKHALHAMTNLEQSGRSNVLYKLARSLSNPHNDGMGPSTECQWRYWSTWWDFLILKPCHRYVFMYTLYLFIFCESVYMYMYVGPKMFRRLQRVACDKVLSVRDEVEQATLWTHVE